MNRQFKFALAVGALIAAGVFPNKTFAATSDDLVARLERVERDLARLERVERENAFLRNRVHRLEAAVGSSRAVTASTTPQLFPGKALPSAVDPPNPNFAVVPTVSKDGAHRWGGLYVGTHVAMSWGTERGIESPLAAGALGLGFDNTTQKIQGWSAGGRVGINLQYDRAVLGAEVSASWEHLGGTSAATPDSGASSCFERTSLKGSTAPATLACAADVTWRTDFLTRAGYAMWGGRVLPYMKGGVSLTNLALSYQFIQPCCQLGSASGTERILVGGVAGGGIEFSVSGTLSLGAEYLYSLYGSQPFDAVSTLTLLDGRTVLNPVPASAHNLTIQTARAFVNYKIDAP